MNPLLIVTKNYRLNRLKCKKAELLEYKMRLEKQINKLAALRQANIPNKSGQLDDISV